MQDEISSYDDLKPFDKEVRPFNLARQASDLIKNQSKNVELFMAAINDIRRLRKFHLDQFIPVFDSIVNNVCYTIEYSIDINQVLCSLMLLKDISQEYITDSIYDCAQLFIPAILKSTFHANESVQELSYMCLNGIANNLFSISVLEALFIVMLKYEKLANNAADTLNGLIYNWDPNHFSSLLFPNANIIIRYIFLIYSNDKKKAIRILELLYFKLGEQNFEILKNLKELTKENEEYLAFMLNNSNKNGNSLENNVKYEISPQK